MKVDVIVGGTPSEVGAAARDAEEVGLDGVFVAETSHDPFLPLVPAALSTQRVQVGTSIAVAFARTPMAVAVLANDLQLCSEGRFVLGLGSQIAAHVTKRFSMPWSKPAARMREFVLAMRAVWAAWNEGTPLDFRGDFYAHTLMTPVFNPGPNPFGMPKVFLAGVGARMTEVAGEVADGFFVHPFTTEQYMREETLPAVQRGLDSAGRARSTLEVSYPVFVVTGRDDAELAENAQPVKQQLAFYASTPAYVGVLEKHGWGDAHPVLHALSKQGEWKRMADVFDDEMLNAFAVVGEPAAIGVEVQRRYGDLADRVTPAMPYEPAGDVRRDVLDAIRAAAVGPSY
ncbi:MAG TPA: TIGR03617 family F420-dependent LLM class oxidoreductase [Acidimicrobiales bacterium]|nr:TIGR03617 family F420-dependent LLM class oxidoreductase [Acidimicrobiales bacterium]